MKLSAYCMKCLVQRQMENIEHYEDEELKSNYMKRVLAIISEAGDNETAPVIIARINKLHQEYFGSPYSFELLKKQYNTKMLQKEENIWSKIQRSEDSLLAALKYSRTGNYIDFGAMGSIDDDKLDGLLESVQQEYIDGTKYEEFIKDLSNAEKLVFLTDNCGEVVLINCL